MAVTQPCEMGDTGVDSSAKELFRTSVLQTTRDRPRATDPRDKAIGQLGPSPAVISTRFTPQRGVYLVCAGGDVMASVDQIREGLEDWGVVTDELPDDELPLWLDRFGPSGVWS